jgi:integrase
MSRELRSALLAVRDQRLFQAWQQGRTAIADDLVFPGESGKPISVRTLVENYFLPTLERAGLRRFRFHDLRHSFGSQLIQSGAPLPYVRDGAQIDPDHGRHVRASGLGSKRGIHRPPGYNPATIRNPGATRVR